MISYLTGRLLSKEPGRCVIDVGGVGYGLNISLGSLGELPEPGETVSLNVHTYVREDQLVLYGFATAKERTIFQKLIGISGVGPKIALAMLSGLTPEDIVEAVAARDGARLATIPGIGKKIADRLIVELGDQLSREFPSHAAEGTAKPRGLIDDAVSALQNLGYPRSVAENALKRAQISATMKVEEAIRMALRELCKA